MMTLADSLRNVAAYIKLRSGKAIEVDHKAPLWRDLVKAANEIDRLRGIGDAEIRNEFFDWHADLPLFANRSSVSRSLVPRQTSFAATYAVRPRAGSDTLS